MISTRGVTGVTLVVVGEERLGALLHGDHGDLRPAPPRHRSLHPLEEALAAAALLELVAQRLVALEGLVGSRRHLAVWPGELPLKVLAHEHLVELRVVTHAIGH